MLIRGNVRPPSLTRNRNRIKTKLLNCYLSHSPGSAWNGGSSVKLAELSETLTNSEGYLLLCSLALHGLFDSFAGCEAILN